MTAAERRADHVRAAVLDIEGIDQPDGAYDVVLCREGLMFAADPLRATREIHRVLRSGGRVAIAASVSARRGFTAVPLAQAVQRAAGWRLSSLPRALETE